MTGGPLEEIDGRMVLPVIWGSDDIGPWNSLYLTMDGNLEIAAIEKVGKPDELPGLTLPPQTLGLSGPIPWTTSETIYPGSAVVGAGTGSLVVGVSKAPIGNVTCDTIFYYGYVTRGSHPYSRPIYASFALGEMNGDGYLDEIFGFSVNQDTIRTACSSFNFVGSTSV